jgi:hypothetical protein
MNGMSLALAVIISWAAGAVSVVMRPFYRLNGRDASDT